MITLLASGSIILVERLKFTAYVKSMVEVPWPCGQCDHPQERAARFEPWLETLYCVLWPNTSYGVLILRVSLSTQGYKWVLANSMLGVTLG